LSLHRPVARAAALGSLALCLCLDPGCRCDHAPSPERTGPDERIASRLDPPPREEGPPRAETAAELASSEREARTLIESLRAGGVPGREAASVADIRGYRLYRRRCYGQALAWFEAALAAEPGHELALLNAARSAHLRGQDRRARLLLARLARLETALARSPLRRAAEDPDLRPLLLARARDARAGASTN